MRSSVGASPLIATPAWPLPTVVAGSEAPVATGRKQPAMRGARSKAKYFIRPCSPQSRRGVTWPGARAGVFQSDGREQLRELGLVEDLDAVLLGGLELGLAGVCTCDEVGCLLRHRAGDLAAGLLDAALDVGARRGERAGDDERLAGLRPGGDLDDGLGRVDALRRELVEHGR